MILLFLLVPLVLMSMFGFMGRGFFGGGRWGHAFRPYRHHHRGFHHHGRGRW